ncbi:MAG: DNA polymerase III subunit gamma/tau [Candidatus Saccharimonadales bacterium]
MGKALYRTYRSRSFDEIVGQSHVTDLLKTAIKNGKISHAYLLTGPRGVGKTSVARIIAHEVNKLPYSEDPHLDIIEIDAASNRRIDDIRDLREKVNIAPVSAPYKVYIIDEVHMLTGESFNALLKTLEEPPSHVIFILATTESHKVPATIISRTQRFHFRPATIEDTVEHLVGITKKEKITAELEALELIAQHGAGSFRDSVSLLDQLAGLGDVTVQNVVSVLGMAETTRVRTMSEAIKSGDLATVVTELGAIQDSGVSPVTLIDQLSRELMKNAQTDPSFYLLLDALCDVPKAYNPWIKLVATVIKFSKPTSLKTVATFSSKSPTLASTPAVLKARVVERKEKEKKAEQVAEKPQPAKSPKTTTNFDWDQVIASIKKHHAPLSSVVARADAQYDQETNILTLVFEYALHRKKLENRTYRNQLGSVLNDLFGINPQLAIKDKNSPGLKSSDAEAVAVIMGGGELVSGAI